MWSVRTHWNVVQPCFEGHGDTSCGGDTCEAYIEAVDQRVRDILPQHLVQYQKDNPVNMSFTCSLYLKLMEVVRLGDSSAEAFDHTFGGLEALLVSGTPFAERRDGLGFEDHMDELAPGTLPGN